MEDFGKGGFFGDMADENDRFDGPDPSLPRTSYDAGVWILRCEFPRTVRCLRKPAHRRDALPTAETRPLLREMSGMAVNSMAVGS
jgi:hypothetical protein